MKEIELTQGQVALVDDEDYEWLNSFNWYASKQSKTYYAQHSTSRVGVKHTTLQMHRLLADDMGFKNLVDHKDRDGLNNQRSNLRDVTHKQNKENVGLYFNNTSGHRGVSWLKGRQKWQAYIHHNGKKIHLGLFDKMEDAIQSRLDMEKKYFTHSEVCT